VKTGYLPDTGDLIWLTFDPQAGREQAGRRPALVLSPATYNTKSGLALVCPITNQRKGYPFEVVVPDGCGVTGVILADRQPTGQITGRWHKPKAACLAS